MRSTAVFLLLLVFFSVARASSDEPPVDVFPTSAPPPKAAPASTNSVPRPGTPGMTPSALRYRNVPPATGGPFTPPPTRPAAAWAPPRGVQTPPAQASTPAPAPTPRSAPPSTTAATFTTLDFPFVHTMTDTNATPQARLQALRNKLATVALPDRQRDIFNNSPAGPLLAKQIAAPKAVEKAAEPVVDLFLQSVHSLHIEVISAGDSMAVVNGRDLYLGDTVIMQTGAFTTQAKVKEIKPTSILFENPVDHHITSLTLPQDPDNLQEMHGAKPAALEDIEGITLQERP